MNSSISSDEERNYFIEAYKICRSLEEHENNLINHRTTWLILIQTVIMATFGFSSQKFYEVYEKTASCSGADVKTAAINNSWFLLFMLLLCVAGLSASIAGYLSIKSATNAQEGVRNLWISQSRKYPDIWLPPLAGGGEQAFFVRFFGSTFARFTAYLFGVFWLLTGAGILVLIWRI